MFHAFPEELFSVLSTVHLLRGLSVDLGLNYSCAVEWRPLAEEALYFSGRLKASVPTLEVDMLNSSKETHVSIEDITESETPTIDVVRTSVKELMEEEMASEQDSTI